MVGGATGDDHDAAQPEQEAVVDFAQISEIHAGAADHALPESVRDGVVLLVDLLEHERLVALLLGGGLIPVDLDDLVFERLAVGCQEFGAFRRHDDQLVVADVLDQTRLPQKPRDRRSDELFALATPDNQRALAARPDQDPWLVSAHRHECVVAAQFRERGPYRLDQAPASAVVRNQMGNDLGVGLRGEDGPHVFEPLLELQVILDDAVDHDVNPVRRVEMGVRVGLVHPSVRGPTGVTDAGLALTLSDRDAAGVVLSLGLDRASQRRQVADRAHSVDARAVEHRDAGAVIAAVLEVLEPRKQQGANLPAPHITDDAAHQRLSTTGAAVGFFRLLAVRPGPARPRPSAGRRPPRSLAGLVPPP